MGPQSIRHNWFPVHGNSIEIERQKWRRKKVCPQQIQAKKNLKIIQMYVELLRMVLLVVMWMCHTVDYFNSSSSREKKRDNENKNSSKYQQAAKFQLIFCYLFFFASFYLFCFVFNRFPLAYNVQKGHFIHYYYFFVAKWTFVARA